MKFLKRWIKSLRGIDTPLGGVSWEPEQILDKEVDFNFPRDSGIQGELERDGYAISWCSPRNLARKIDIEGSERVVWKDRNGDQFYLKTRDGLTLIKSK